MPTEEQTFKPPGGLGISMSGYQKVKEGMLSTHSLSLCFFLVTATCLDVKHYYTHYMPHVSAQPWSKCDLMSSLLEWNASEFAAQLEWEAEWNQLGLASRLSEEVCTGELEIIGPFSSQPYC